VSVFLACPVCAEADAPEGLPWCELCEGIGLINNSQKKEYKIACLTDNLPEEDSWYSGASAASFGQYVLPSWFAYQYQQTYSSSINYSTYSAIVCDPVSVSFSNISSCFNPINSSCFNPINKITKDFDDTIDDIINDFKPEVWSLSPTCFTEDIIDKVKSEMSYLFVEKLPSTRLEYLSRSPDVVEGSNLNDLFEYKSLPAHGKSYNRKDEKLISSSFPKMKCSRGAIDYSRHNASFGANGFEVDMPLSSAKSRADSFSAEFPP